MINKADIARRFGQNASTYEESAAVQYRAAEVLASHMEVVCMSGGRMFEVGCGTGILTRMLMKRLKPHSYIVNDISDGMLDQMVSASSDNVMAILPGDAEQISWPMDTDIVVSASAVQWFEDPLSFVSKACKCMSAGGVVGLVTYGPQTFRELSTLGIEGLHYPSLGEWRGRFEKKGFEVLVCENHLEVLHYPTAIDVMRELQRAGVTSSSRPLMAGAMRTLMTRYEDMFRCEQGVPITYDVYIIVAKLL